jgi:hypothetical protein
MLWRQDTVDEIADKLNKLGLSACSVCGSPTALHADRRPIVMSIGGVAWVSPEAVAPPRREPSTNIVFMVRVACDVCGHTLLFDSESFFGGDAPTLEQG